MKEEWVKLYCSDIYEVSNLGRVRSLNREVKIGGKNNIQSTKKVKSKILSQNTSCGYPSFTIYDPTTDSKRKRIRTHKAVYHSFNVNPSIEDCLLKKLVVDHIDGNKFNSSLGNLELVTYQENSLRYHKGRDNKFPTYITDMGSNGSNHYISKKIKGKSKVFGKYNCIEEAIKRRDELIKNGWIE